MRRFKTLKEALNVAESTLNSRQEKLLEQRNAINAERYQLRKQIREAREAVVNEHLGLYEACARKLGVSTESQDWKDQVTKKLQESKVL